MAAIIRAGRISYNAKERSSKLPWGQWTIALSFSKEKEKEIEPSHNILRPWCNFSQILLP